MAPTIPASPHASRTWHRCIAPWASPPPRAPLLVRALAIAEASLPPDHQHLAIYRNNLAALGPP